MGEEVKNEEFVIYPNILVLCFEPDLSEFLFMENSGVEMTSQMFY